MRGYRLPEGLSAPSSLSPSKSLPRDFSQSTFVWDARFEAAGRALTVDGDDIAVAVRSDGELDVLALAVLGVVGDARRFGVVFGPEREVAVHLKDALDLRQIAQRGGDGLGAALAGAVVEDGNAGVHRLDEHGVV